MFLSVYSLNILDVYFLYGTHCLMHTWACYILSVHTGATDNESVYLLLQYFFFLFPVFVFSYISIYHVSCAVHGLNAETSHSILLDLRRVITRLNLYNLSSFFCLT